jgi:hypothetical protein
MLNVKKEEVSITNTKHCISMLIVDWHINVT